MKKGIIGALVVVFIGFFASQSNGASPIDPIWEPTTIVPSDAVRDHILRQADALASDFTEPGEHAVWKAQRAGTTQTETLAGHYWCSHGQNLMFFAGFTPIQTRLGQQTHPYLFPHLEGSCRFISALLKSVLPPGATTPTLIFKRSAPQSAALPRGLPANVTCNLLESNEIVDVSFPVSGDKFYAACCSTNLFPMFFPSQRIIPGVTIPPRVGRIGHIRIYIARNPATGELGRIATVFLSE